jgi:alpha-L-fucosidase 2
MILGCVDEEPVQLNEATPWSGGPVQQNINPQSPQYLPEVREALFRGEYDSANTLVKKMQGLYSESFMPLGDLVIRQDFGGTQPSSYYRDLNIKDALSVTRFTIDSTQYKREIFASAPNQVIVIRLSASKPKQLNMLITARSILRSRIDTGSIGELILSGKAPAHVDPSYYNENKDPVIYGDPGRCRGMRFALVIKAISKYGKIKTDNVGI